MTASFEDGYSVPQDAISDQKVLVKDGVAFFFENRISGRISLMVSGKPGSKIANGYYSVPEDVNLEDISMDNVGAKSGILTFNSIPMEFIQQAAVIASEYVEPQKIGVAADGVYEMPVPGQEQVYEAAMRQKQINAVSDLIDQGYQVPAALLVGAERSMPPSGELSEEQQARRAQMIKQRQQEQDLAARKDALIKYLDAPDGQQKQSLLTQYAMGCVSTNGLSFKEDANNAEAAIFITAMQDFESMSRDTPKDFMVHLKKAMSVFGVANRIDAEAIDKITAASAKLIATREGGGRVFENAAKGLKGAVFALYDLDPTPQAGQDQEKVTAATNHFANVVERVLGKESVLGAIKVANQGPILTPEQEAQQTREAEETIRKAKATNAARLAKGKGLTSAASGRDRRLQSQEALDLTPEQKWEIVNGTTEEATKSAQGQEFEALFENFATILNSNPLSRENRSLQAAGVAKISKIGTGNYSVTIGDGVSFNITRDESDRSNFGSFQVDKGSAVTIHDNLALAKQAVESLSQRAASPTFHVGSTEFSNDSPFGTVKRGNPQDPTVGRRDHLLSSGPPRETPPSRPGRPNSVVAVRDPNPEQLLPDKGRGLNG